MIRKQLIYSEIKTTKNIVDFVLFYYMINVFLKILCNLEETV